MRHAMNLHAAVLALTLYATTMSLCGCANLTVDVDMYKGPLANQDMVQEEQIKAMVIGAKSVLAALRNDLHETSVGEAKRAPVPPQYQHCFWPRPVNLDPNSWIRDAYAIRVNAVLSLYCDATPAELETYVSQIRVRMNRIASARNLLGLSAERDEVLWRAVSVNFYGGKSLGLHPAVKHIREKNASLAQQVNTLTVQVERLTKEDMRFREEAKSLAPDEATKAARQKKIDANNAKRDGLQSEIQRLNKDKQRLEDVERSLRAGYDRLEQGYQELLAPPSTGRPYRWVDAIAQGHNMVAEAYRDLPELSKKAPFPVETIADDANTQFDRLRGAELVTRHLRFLSKGEQDGRAEADTVEFVNGVATAFLDSRQDLEETLRLTLDLIDYLASNPIQSVDQRQYLRATIRFALCLVKCGALAAALEKPNPSPAVEGLRLGLSKALDGQLGPETKWDDVKIGSWKEALSGLFEENPGKTSRELLQAHVSFIGGAYDVPKGHAYEKYKTPSSRRFGICLASPERDGADVLQEVLRSHGGWVEKISGAAGLERGRLAQGLETLIDDCLRLRENLAPWSYQTTQEEELAQAESRLPAALIGLGEKVLVIANYDTLLRGLEKKGRKQSTRERNEREQRIRRYTDVLQTVGNSIIVQANELSARAEHREKLRLALDREAGAIEYAFAQHIGASTLGERTQASDGNAGNEPDEASAMPSTRTASDTDGGASSADETSSTSLDASAVTSTGNGGPGDVNKPIAQTAKDMAEAQPAQAGGPFCVDPNFWRNLVVGSQDAKEVLDNLIAVLRYKHAADILKSGPDCEEAKNTAAALQKLHEQRADMVYIRPSSAYLRSSYPAASLQRDPEHLSSQPMLTQRFINWLQSFKKSEQRRQWDIDKQYWQNVNQIRVSATGSSNYVVAKDDVGNWYIKGYSSDPNCIIQGVRSVALLAGAGMGTGAIAGAATLASAQTGQPLASSTLASAQTSRPLASSPTPSTSPQLQQIKKIDEAYREQLKTDLAALVKDVNGLAAHLSSRWAADPNTKQHLSEFEGSAVKEANKSLTDRCRKLKDSNDPNEARRVVAVFTAIRTFNDKVDAKIADLSLKGVEKDEPIKKKARDIARRTVCDFLLPRIERCASAVQHQEMVLLVLGTSQGKQVDSGSSPASQKPGSTR